MVQNKSQWFHIFPNDKLDGVGVDYLNDMSILSGKDRIMLMLIILLIL